MLHLLPISSADLCSELSHTGQCALRSNGVTIALEAWVHVIIGYMAGEVANAVACWAQLRSVSPDGGAFDHLAVIAFARLAAFVHDASGLECIGFDPACVIAP